MLCFHFLTPALLELCTTNNSAQQHSVLGLYTVGRHPPHTCIICLPRSWELAMCSAKE